MERPSPPRSRGCYRSGEEKEKTFEFRRMPFGLKNAGASYCRLVKAVVDDLKVATYLDDVRHYRDFLQELTADMNCMKAKRKWAEGDWDPTLAKQFQEPKDLFCKEGGLCQAFEVYNYNIIIVLVCQDCSEFNTDVADLIRM